MEPLSADPLIYADITFIRETVADFAAQGRFSAGVAEGIGQMFDFVVTTLEAQALMARAAGKVVIFEGKMSVFDALLRAAELRGLLADWRG